MSRGPNLLISSAGWIVSNIIQTPPALAPSLTSAGAPPRTNDWLGVPSDGTGRPSFPVSSRGNMMSL
jgi:hypothetical protein